MDYAPGKDGPEPASARFSAEAGAYLAGCMRTPRGRAVRDHIRAREQALESEPGGARDVAVRAILARRTDAVRTYEEVAAARRERADATVH